jgi:hypothetical protein
MSLDNDDEEDLYGENYPLEKCRFLEANIISVDDLYNPHRVGACCTATSMIINGKLNVGYYHPTKLKGISESKQTISKKK